MKTHRITAELVFKENPPHGDWYCYSSGVMPVIRKRLNKQRTQR